MQTTATLSCRRQAWNNKLSGFQHFINVFAENTENCMIQCLRYTAKNYQLFKAVENRMQQSCAAHIVHSCQQYCSALLSLIAG